MEAGVKYNIPFKEYESWDAVNNSSLSRMAKSPKHYKYFKDNPPEKNNGLVFGAAVHKLILEPTSFDDDFGVYNGTRRGKAWEEFKTNNQNLEIITETEHKLAHTLKNELLTDKNWQTLTELPQDMEVSLLWKHSDSLLKGRIDISTKETIYDIKTTKNASKESFLRSIKAYGYHRQAAMYVDGLECLGMGNLKFVLIALEKTPPYSTAFYEIDEYLIEEGRREYLWLLEKLKECQDTNHWPSYTETTQTIGTMEENLELDLNHLE